MGASSEGERCGAAASPRRRSEVCGRASLVGVPGQCGIRNGIQREFSALRRDPRISLSPCFYLVPAFGIEPKTFRLQGVPKWYPNGRHRTLL